MQREFERIAIVNRGEPAVRALRAVREWSRETGARLGAVALYTDPDRDARFVREADASFGLGSATWVDARDGRRRSRYLDFEVLERALRETRADAAWVGWGFVAEDDAFAELCARLGVVFVGPDPDVMRRLGDKIGSKRLAERAGVPVAPWSGAPVDTLSAAREQAERLGFPLMIKATAGGGGRGIRRVRAGGELADAFESARSEAEKGFGDPTVFMERLLEGARHIEVQIVGDAHGTVWALGVRDCTIQRRNQKVLEESPSPALDATQQRAVCDAAVRLGKEAGYRNAGTVEFLYDAASGRFSFMEVNTRLQVEHPITEAVTGVDLVKLQLHVARGGRLEGDPPVPRGHAIEVRINAEDPERGFAPTPGRVDLFQLPGGPGVRVDSGFSEGDHIAPEFDSMLAKVVAHGRDRDEALARLARALAETQLAVRGGASNKGFLLGLLARPEVRNGEVDVGWLDRLAAEDRHLPREHADAALIQAAVDAYDAEFAVEQVQFLTSAARGRPRVRAEVGRAVELRHRGRTYALRVHRLGPRDYRVEVDGARIGARVEPASRFERRLRFGDRHHHVVTHGEGPDRLVEVDGVPHRLSRDDAGIVRSPAPAVVLRLAVGEGDEVARGDRLAVLEAMKTELPVLAPFPGKVREIRAAPNTQVDTGAPLLVLEPLEREEETAPAARVRFDAVAAGGDGDAGVRCRRHLEELRRLMLGFDVDPAEMRRLVDERRALCVELPVDHADLLRGEDQIMTAFADICALFRRRDADADADESGSQQEHLLGYLRSLDTAGAGLPPLFLDRVRRALSHYGVDGLERAPGLEEALLWIWKAHQRMGEQAGVVVSILERRIDQLDVLGPLLGDDFRGLLDRVVAAARGRHPAISDLAREVRYRYFDRPFFERAREQVYAGAEARLAALASAEAGGGAAAAGRDEGMRVLVECPQPLAGLYTRRAERAGAGRRRLMLEILTRRYYRIRRLEGVRTLDAGGRSFALAEYDHDETRVHVLTTFASLDDLGSAAAAMRPLLEAAPEPHDVVVDFYLWRSAPHGEPDEVARALEERLGRAAFPRRIRRVVAALAVRDGGRGMGAMQHFTFRPAEPPESGFREERLVRGLHPMMGKRLQLWRLDNFEIERLPSAEDVYLFRGVARGNPRDERLFAFAEVRDLSPLRDENGQVVRLPHLERMWREALAGIRLAQSRRGSRQRLHWNRVLLYVWPPLELGAEAISELGQRLLPDTADLGLEKTVLRARVPGARAGELRDTVIQLGSPGGRELVISFTEPADEPIRPLSEYAQKVVGMRRRGLVYPYELIRMLTPPRNGTHTRFPPGDFVELDLDEAGRLVPVERPPGRNRANVVMGRIRSYTTKHPEGMERLVLLGDPSREMGSFAEPECRRIIAALDDAEARGVPLEWFAVSAGAKISMDSGTENLDWTAAALRRIIEFTQGGGEINVVVAGVNVGGQSYWNAEATMLMHTRGILIMIPESSMVLTGKRALDYSGGISAEDNPGIGGYDRIMGVNGQAQYWAGDIEDACHLLLRHYEHAYVAPGERFPRRAASDDPFDRDIRSYPHGRGDGYAFDLVGEVFSSEHNPGRRKPFDIRAVMRAVIDQDHAPLERWRDMREAEIAVVWDAHLGGHPVCLIGFESRQIPRLGFTPGDGPDAWTAGTLFPLSSKKVARAVNAASGNRPVVLIANLSGFDGSPESMRRLQLEYGAEIGRAVVNFRGPIVFCVVSRYHGGAYVVFSRTLNENLEVAALEGSYASVIGGAPAAAVVFAGEVERRTRADARLEGLEREIAGADAVAAGRLRARWHEVFAEVRSEKLGEVAEEFEQVHSVHRAHRVGSLHHILSPARLRPFLIGAVERGQRRELQRASNGDAPAPRPGRSA